MYMAYYYSYSYYYTLLLYHIPYSILLLSTSQLSFTLPLSVKYTSGWCGIPEAPSRVETVVKLSHTIIQSLYMVSQVQCTCSRRPI